jgi:hypothetical protein
MNPEDLEAAMCAALAEPQAPNFLQGTQYVLSPAQQKKLKLSFLGQICSGNPAFQQNWLDQGGESFGKTYKELTASFAAFGSMSELAEVRDRKLKNYLLRVASIAYIVRSKVSAEDRERLAALIRKLDKDGYIVLLMEVVEQFFAESYQPLVDFINEMATQPRPSKVVAEGAVGGGAAIDDSLCGIVRVEIVNGGHLTREDLSRLFGGYGEVAYVDHTCLARTKGGKSVANTQTSFIRFSHQFDASTVFPAIEFEGAHLSCRLLTDDETRAYIESVEKKTDTDKLRKIQMKAADGKYTVVSVDLACGPLLNEVYRLSAADGQTLVFFGDRTQAAAVARELENAVLPGEKEQKAANSRLEVHLRAKLM